MITIALGRLKVVQQNRETFLKKLQMVFVCSHFSEMFSNRMQLAIPQVRIQGGAPGARAPPLTLGFEAPKLSIFGPYLIFP